MITVFAAAAALVIFLGFLLVRSESLERRFRKIHPDESETRLLEVVGAPSEIRRCGEGNFRLPPDDGAVARRCMRVYWYSTYILKDGWLVPIDDTGHIIQIKRLALP
jgi:hypothetical protein